MRKVAALLYSIFLFFNVNSLTGYCTEFSKKEIIVIYNESLKILESYKKSINLIGELHNTNIKKAESQAENLIELFLNRKILVYNDLDPAHQLSEFYEIETYTSNLILWYPDGMIVDFGFENAKGSEIKDYGENVYSIDILAKKFIEGNYFNKTLNTNQEELIFRIAFIKKNNKLEDFKIVGIRNPTSETKIDDTKAFNEMKSEAVSEDELEKVHTFTRQILEDYIRSLALLGSTEEPENEKEFYVNAFKDLFLNIENKVYNDIQPKPENPLLSIDEYITNYQDWYAEGIKNIALNLDSAEYSMIIPVEGNKYYTYIYANKFFSGKYQGRQIFRNPIKLIFKITFERTGNTYANFKIESIDRSGIKFYNEDDGLQETSLSKNIKKISHKGFSVAYELVAGVSSITDNNIKGQTLQNNYNEWDYKYKPGYSGEIKLKYFFTNILSINAGLSFSSFSSTYSLYGVFQDNEYSLDLDGGSYNKIVTANYDSAINISYISLPIGISLMNKNPEKVGLFIECDLSFGYLLSARYKATGDYQLQGYYENFHPVLQYLTFPEWGFYSYSNLNNTGILDVKKFSVLANISCGVTIPIGYFSSICLGPKIILGLLDISNNRENYINIFGKEELNKGIYLKLLGFKISYNFKI